MVCESLPRDAQRIITGRTCYGYNDSSTESKRTGECFQTEILRGKKRIKSLGMQCDHPGLSWNLEKYHGIVVSGIAEWDISKRIGTERMSAKCIWVLTGYLLEHYFCKSQQGGLAMVSMINKAILRKDLGQ